MRKVVSIGLLTGAIALTGLAGSAYAAAGEGPTSAPAPKGAGGKPIAVACVKVGTGKDGVPKFKDGVPKFGTRQAPKDGRQLVVVNGGAGTQSFRAPGPGKVTGNPTTVRIDEKGGKPVMQVTGGEKGAKCFLLPKDGSQPIPPGDLKTGAVPPGAVEISPAPGGVPAPPAGPSGN